MIRLHLEADLPDALVQSFLQAVRDWEQQHPHVQLAVKLGAESLSERAALAIFDQMDPPLPFLTVIPKP